MLRRSLANWRRPMSPAAFIDANVPIYASGREHPNKEPVCSGPHDGRIVPAVLCH